MSDNTVLVKYVGSAPWFESSVTGRQTKWLPGHSDYVSAAISQQLAATGLFEVGAAVPVMAQTNQVTGGITKIWSGTQAQYDAIATPADDTLYIIVEA